MMEDVVLLAGVAALLVFGWFLMKRLDGFLSRNARGIPTDTRSGGDTLRIAVSDPMTAGALSQPIERLCRAYPDIEVRLYTADAESVLTRLEAGRLDAAFFPREQSNRCPPGCETVEVWLCRENVVTAALPLLPMDPGRVAQRLIWVKCACGGAADEFASQTARIFQQPTGNETQKKV